MKANIGAPNFGSANVQDKPHTDFIVRDAKKLKYNGHIVEKKSHFISFLSTEKSLNFVTVFVSRG